MNRNLILTTTIATLFSNSPLCGLVLSATAAVTSGTPAIISTNPQPLSPIAISKGDNSNSQNTSCISMKKTTSGGTLDVVLDPSPQPIGKKDQTKFKVIFLQKGEIDKIQSHIDYDFIITKNGGKQLFQASTVAGQQGIPLHTAEGIVTIPYKFQGTGEYLVNVTISGVLFNEIRPESVIFPIKVTAAAPASGNPNANGSAAPSIQQPAGVILLVYNNSSNIRLSKNWALLNNINFNILRVLL